MTRDDFKTNLEVEFENSDNYSEADLDNAIQEGYEEVSSFAGSIFKATTLAFTADLTYYDLKELISDYLGLVALYNTVTRRWMVPTSMKRLEAERWDWETAVGTPEWFVPISYRYMAIYKKPGEPDYGDLHVFYRATAPVLAGSDDILIPEDHIGVLEDYAAMDLLEKTQEWTKASMVMKRYQEGILTFRDFVQNSRLKGRIPILREGV